MSEHAALVAQQQQPTNVAVASKLQVLLRILLVIIVALLSMLSFSAILGLILVSSSKSSANNFSNLQNICGHVKAISKQEFSQRRDSLVQQLVSNAFDAVVMEPSASMSYFANISWSRSERPFLLVATHKGTFAVICPAFEARTALEKIDFSVSLMIWQENENPYQKVADFLLQELGPKPSFLVSVESETRTFIVEGLTQQSIQPTSGKEMIRKLRMIKSKAEQDIMKCANEATQAAIKAVYDSGVLQVGVTELQVAQTLTSALVAAGLRNNWMLVLFGADASFPHGTKLSKKLENGDLVLIDTGGELLGYQSDITRTFQFGNVNNATRSNAWNLVYKAESTALELIKPGVTCASVAQAARDVIVNGGYGPGYTYFTHRLGHGIGMQGHEDPYMVESNTNTILAPGMTFSVEPGIYVPNDFGIRIEDIVVVTETGYELVVGLFHQVLQRRSVAHLVVSFHVVLLNQKSFYFSH